MKVVMKTKNIDSSLTSSTSNDDYKFKVRCSCCGKVFITEEPKQDLCTQCMNELADYLALDCE